MFFSCTQHYDSERIKINDSITRKIYYREDGKIARRADAINDSIKHGLDIHYFTNGKIKEITPYKMGVVSGYVDHYYNSGTIKSKAFWQNNLPDGSCAEYSDEGIITAAGHYKNGKSYGSQLFFYPSNRIKAYNAFDNSANYFYLKFFSEEGSEIEKHGTLISRNYGVEYWNDSSAFVDENHVKLNSEFYLVFCVAHPPDNSLILATYKNDMNNFDELITETISNYGEEHRYRIKFDKIGKVRISIRALISSNKLIDVLEGDTLNIDFNVKRVNK